MCQAQGGDLMRRLYFIILNINALSLFFVIYLIKEHISVVPMNHELSCIIYLLSVFLLSGICLMLSRFLPRETMTGDIKEVELANNSFLPSFLGYFFVALSVADNTTLIVAMLIIFIFTYHSQILYFNPLFLVFGYKFYYITKNNGMKLFVITKKSIKSINGLKFDSLKRINDYTFIDRGKQK